jgi:hypothetical protein
VVAGGLAVAVVVVGDGLLVLPAGLVVGGVVEEGGARARLLVVGTLQRVATSSQCRFLMDSFESSCWCGCVVVCDGGGRGG